jgi:hypothetical protein
MDSDIWTMKMKMKKLVATEMAFICETTEDEKPG